MRISMQTFTDFIAKVTGLLIFTSFIPAYAYVDPGSGSVIVTTILGIFAAIGYTFRKYFYKLRRTLMGKKEQIEDDNKTEN